MLFDGLSELRVIDVLEDEDGFDNLAELFQSPVEDVLFRVGVESFEELRGRRVLELDGRDEA